MRYRIHKKHSLEKQECTSGSRHDLSPQLVWYQKPENIETGAWEQIALAIPKYTEQFSVTFPDMKSEEVQSCTSQYKSAEAKHTLTHGQSKI